jgi:hypothetical protein
VYGISLRLQYASGIDPETPTHTIVSRNINSHQGLGYLESKEDEPIPLEE